jgi:hypothetical protein
MANLETLPGAAADPKTTQGWQQHANAWALADKLSKHQELQCRGTSRSSTPLPGKPLFVEACAGRLPDAHCTWPSWGAMRAVSHRAEIELQVPFNDKKRIASSSR